jgi:hypothetical protein
VTRRSASLSSRRRRRITRAAPDRLDPAVAQATLVAWWVLLFVSLVVQPPPDGTAATTTPLWLVLGVDLTILATIAVASVALLRNRRLGAWVAFGGAIGMMAATVACPVTGHHAMGPWWLVAMGAQAGMAATGWYALRSDA